MLTPRDGRYYDEDDSQIWDSIESYHRLNGFLDFCFFSDVSGMCWFLIAMVCPVVIPFVIYLLCCHGKRRLFRSTGYLGTYQRVPREFHLVGSIRPTTTTKQVVVLIIEE